MVGMPYHSSTGLGGYQPMTKKNVSTLRFCEDQCRTRTLTKITAHPGAFFLALATMPNDDRHNAIGVFRMIADPGPGEITAVTMK